jgi:hypothetical protein
MHTAVRTYLKFLVPYTFEFQISVIPHIQPTKSGVSLDELGRKTLTTSSESALVVSR